MAKFIQRWTVAAVLLVTTSQVAAQWGGAFMNQEGQGVDPSQGFGSQMFGNRFDQREGAPPGSHHAGSNQGGMPGTEEPEGWLPTARPGYEIPAQVKKMMEATKSAKPTSRAEFRDNTGFVNKMNRQTGAAESDEDADDEADEESYRQHIPKTSPGRSSGDGKRIDKCLKKVSYFCSMRIMHENFASFCLCVSEMRYRLDEQCKPWAEGHGPCAKDMVQYCSKLSPADTTECLKKNKPALTRACVDSGFYMSMEEGFQEFRNGMQEGMKGQPPGPSRYAGPQSGDDDTIPGQQRSPPSENPSARETPDIVRLRPKKVAEDLEDF